MPHDISRRDPTPERWGEYMVPCNRVVKRFWVGTDGGSSS